MSGSTRHYRQFVGLAIVVVTYVGGIIGWSIAAVNVQAESEAPDELETRELGESRRNAPALKVVIASTDWEQID